VTMKQKENVKPI